MASTTSDSDTTATAKESFFLNGAAVGAGAPMIALTRSITFDCLDTDGIGECAAPISVLGFGFNETKNLGSNKAEANFTGEVDIKGKRGKFTAETLVLGFHKDANATPILSEYLDTNSSGLHKEPVECKNNASSVWTCN